MKKLIVLFLLVFLISCSVEKQSLTEQPNTEKVEQQLPLQKSELKTKSPSMPSENYYKFYLDNELDFNGNKIKLLDINNEGETTLDINSNKWIMYETDTEDIVYGMKVVVQELNYDYINKTKIYAVVTVERFELKPNEYLIKDKQTMTTINGAKTTLKRVNFDKSIILDYNKELSLRILEGSTLETQGVSITNVKAFPRPITSESYALIKVTP
ncbi:hypothetical protein J4409_01785 [Candidatus Woesearchaeota archaeon]|nr:hypothetical protein [Candidatus Woesearchaeota archaeon]